MGATRLPGKPLMRVLGKPLLSYLIERLQRSEKADLVAVLTTLNPQDQKIIQTVHSESIPFFCGSEENVLDRYYQAAVGFQASVIVRITADCPLADPGLIDEMIATFHASDFDYYTNALQRSYPRGLDIEIFTFKALEKAWQQAKELFEKEHVTPYIYRHPDQFKLGHKVFREDLSAWRWTVDTKEDFIVISKLIGALYPQNPEFTYEDVIRICRSHPEWMAINAHIAQKQLPVAISYS